MLKDADNLQASRNLFFFQGNILKNYFHNGDSCLAPDQTAAFTMPQYPNLLCIAMETSQLPAGKRFQSLNMMHGTTAYRDATNWDLYLNKKTERSSYAEFLTILPPFIPLYKP
jgi:hypothetical protein